MAGDPKDAANGTGVRVRNLIIGALAGLSLFAGALLSSGVVSGLPQIAPTAVQAALLNNQPLVLPERGWRAIERELAANPFRIELLTLLFVQATPDRAKARHDPEALASLIRRFGRRSTVAQLALIVDSAKKNELPSVMGQLDTLLRRGQQTDFAFSFLHQLERHPVGRSELVQALARKPDWTVQYLNRPHSLADEQGLDGRVALLSDARKTGLKLSREHLAASVRALEAADRREEAFEIWASIEPESARRPIGDPDFQTLQKYGPEQAYLLTGFDWQIHSGTGYYTSVSSSPAMPVVHVDWDGRGVPLFLSQTLRGVRGRRVSLDLETQTPPTQVAAGLAVSARCPGGQDVLFAPVPRGDAASTVQYRSESAMPCPFPQLRLSGKLREIGSATELTLVSIDVSEEAGSQQQRSVEATAQ